MEHKDERIPGVFLVFLVFLVFRMFYLFPFSKRLDLDVDACWKIQFHQRIHRVLSGLENIEQTFMRPDFELFARLLIHMRRPQHRIAVLNGGQRNWPRHSCTGPLGGVDNLRRRLVQNAVIVRLEADADAFS